MAPFLGFMLIERVTATGLVGIVVGMIVVATGIIVLLFPWRSERAEGGGRGPD